MSQKPQFVKESLKLNWNSQRGGVVVHIPLCFFVNLQIISINVRLGAISKQCFTKMCYIKYVKLT